MTAPEPETERKMQATEELIRTVVQQVLSQLQPQANGAPRGFAGRHGVFTCVDEAVAAATPAFDELRQRTLADHKRIIHPIPRISIQQSGQLGTLALEETRNR